MGEGRVMPKYTGVRKFKKKVCGSHSLFVQIQIGFMV